MADTIEEFAELLVQTLGRIDGTIILDGPPDADLGYIGAVAIDLENKLFYGPKTEAGWGSGEPLAGAAGSAGEITSVSVAAGTPGSGASIVLGGTASARTIALTIATGLPGETGVTPDIQIGDVVTLAPGAEVVVEISGTAEAPVLALSIPQGDAGATGAVPNITANLNLIAHGETGAVTRSGPDTAPVLTFNIPTPLNGDPGREVEFNVTATHIQTRYVGETTWVDLIALAALTGAQGGKGDGLQIDARGANLAARDGFDAEAEDFTFLDLETGDLYWRETSTPGVWSTAINIGGVGNAILEALGALNATPGLVEQTGAATFTKRTIGVASDASIPTRLDADGRYRRQTDDVALEDVTGLPAALDGKADAGAVMAALGGKQDADATLAALAGLTVAADKLLYATGPDAFATATLTAVARTLIAQTTQALMRTAGLGMSANGSSLVAAADYAAMRTALGLVVGTDVQAYDADLAAIAALTTTTFGRSLLTIASAADIKPLECFAIALSDEATAITTGTAKVTWRAPYGFTITAVRASLATASSSGIPTVDINEGGSSILSTKLTIDAGEKTSVTAATAVVISDPNLADDAELTFDIDVAGTGAKGLKVSIYGYRA